jgi:hypothetical protein
VPVDANSWGIIIAAIGLVLTQILGMILAYMRDRNAAKKVAIVAQKAEVAAKKADIVARKVDDAAYLVHQVAVKADRADDRLQETNDATSQALVNLQASANKNQETTDAVQKTGDTIHTLFNSAMSAQLRSHAVLARRLADITNEVSDIDTAHKAEDAADEHDKKQRSIDVQNEKGG